MSTVTIGYIVDLVRKAMLDENDVDYTDTQMVSLFNLCTRQIISKDPSAYVVIQDELLAAGVEQTIPTNQPLWLELAEAICNMGTDGLTEGAPVTEAILDSIQKLYPTWRSEAASTTVQHFIRIPNVKDKYYVYPPSTGTNYLKVKGVAVPTDIVYDANGDWESQVISIDDRYVEAYKTGMVYLAYTEDTDIPGNLPQNGLYYQRFLNSLGLTE